jgi:hypothetical protein
VKSSKGFCEKAIFMHEGVCHKIPHLHITAPPPHTSTWKLANWIHFQFNEFWYIEKGDKAILQPSHEFSLRLSHVEFLFWLIVRLSEELSDKCHEAFFLPARIISLKAITTVYLNLLLDTKYRERDNRIFYGFNR